MKSIALASQLSWLACTLNASCTISTAYSRRGFASTPKKFKNRIYNPVRHPHELDSLTLLSASTRTALITLWTASWCPSCRTVAPLVRDMIENNGIAEGMGGISYAEVEFDSPTLGELSSRYMITSIPTLLAFSRQEAQMQTRLIKVDKMKDREFLRCWIEDEARRGGRGGKGGKNFFTNMLGLGEKS